MLSSVHTIILHLYLLTNSIQSHIIDCSDSIHCQNKFINCLPHEDCFVLCDDNKSCSGSVINCPIDGDCIIECHGIESCLHTTIDATLSYGNLDIECDGNDISCKGLKIFGSTLPDNTGNFNLICNGNTQSCIESNILCPYNGNCDLICNSDTSCMSIKIIGPNTGNLTIECNNIKSCINSIFDGSKSHTLNIKGCTEYESCLDISLYCPPHTKQNNHKNCFLEGNDNLGKYMHNDNTTQSRQISDELFTKLGYIDEDNHSNTLTLNNNINIGKGVFIYAKFGWKDIDINYKGTFGIGHVGKMICGDNYDRECNISHSKWSCMEQNEFCDILMDTQIKSNDIIYINTTHNGSIYSEENILGIDYIDIERYGENKGNIHMENIFNIKVILLIIACLVLLFCCICIGYVQSRHNYVDHIEGEGENILIDNGYEHCRNKYDIDEHI